MGLETRHPFRPHRAGFTNFFWFIGKVEDRDDPQKIGRMRVRPLSVYPSEDEVETEKLPWAIPIQSIVSSALEGIGVSPTGIQVGSWVVGFFLDDDERQQPVIIGTLAGNEDVAKLAQGTNTVEKELIGPEPESPYEAKYPFNKVITTENGHVIEVDDTEGSRRIHIYHASGTYIEINEDGRIVTKSVEEQFNITKENLNIYVGEDRTTQIEANSNTVIGENSDVLIEGNSNTEVIGKVYLKTGEDYEILVGENYRTFVDKNSILVVDNFYNIQAENIEIDIEKAAVIKANKTVDILSLIHI